MGHTDQEISAAFSQFDQDGNQVLDADEQERMKRELEEKRVWFHSSKNQSNHVRTEDDDKSVFLQDALSAELNNLGKNYEKESVEKVSFTSQEQKSLSNQTFVDQQQFQRWERSSDVSLCANNTKIL